MRFWIPITLFCAPVGVSVALAQTVPGAVFDGIVANDAAAPGALVTFDDGRGTPYIVSKSDNICGLIEPRQISTPAKVDYDALLEATPEVQKIRKDGIDPNSSRGITLMTKARSRVLKACEVIRTANGYDSIWKVISRRDKKDVVDATSAVKAKIKAGAGSAFGTATSTATTRPS